MRDDLLGAGPKTVEELRSIAGRLRVKYQNQMERKIQRAQQQAEREKNGGGEAPPMMAPPPQIKESWNKASSLAGGFFNKVKSTKFPTSFAGSQTSTSSRAATPGTTATIVDLPPLHDAPAAGAPAAATAPAKAPSTAGSDGDWVGTDMKPATDAISNFSIGDDDDDADLLL